MDSPCTTIQHTSVKVFKQEIAWATHLSVPAVLLPTPTLSCTNYARCLNEVILQLNFLQAWVRVPLMSAAQLIRGGDADPSQDPWRAWNRLRELCEEHKSVSVCLEITGDLPDANTIDRWMGEPVKAAIFPTSIFLTNKKGYPTLSRPHQDLLLRLFRHKVQLILKGRPQHPDGTLPYVQYLYHLFTRRGDRSEQQEYESPYLDYLQAPLQPLMDNLESATYETFERDPIKYRQYEEAVRRALLDTPPDQTSVVMVVGAGRGPLVKASLRAATHAGRRVRVYAVEKNPNAVVTLRNMAATHNWGAAVTVVATDMRTWRAPEKADILVSELLGSFGDNELSPECLWGAQRFLKPGGVSIPQDYTSFAAPILTPKLWNEVKSYGELKHFETAYVVKLHNFFQLDDAKPVFYFQHPDHSGRVPCPAVARALAEERANAEATGIPSQDRAPDLSRYTVLKFTSRCDSMMHGFAGYFESVLYSDVIISINPATFSTGMFSWFPIYFPLRTPVAVKAGEEIECHFWRCTSSTKVWYEWCVVQPQPSPIHNPNGRSYWIGL